MCEVSLVFIGDNDSEQIVDISRNTGEISFVTSPKTTSDGKGEIKKKRERKTRKRLWQLLD